MKIEVYGQQRDTVKETYDELNPDKIAAIISRLDGVDATTIAMIGDVYTYNRIFLNCTNPPGRVRVWYSFQHENLTLQDETQPLDQEIDIVEFGAVYTSWPLRYTVSIEIAQSLGVYYSHHNRTRISSDKFKWIRADQF